MQANAVAAFVILAALALALGIFTLAQFRHEMTPAGAPNTYLLRDRWTGDILLCGPPDCIKLKTELRRTL